MSPPAPQLRVIPGGSSGEPTEAELVRAFSAGDSSAFGTLIKRHQETVFRVVRRYARSAEDARDLTQRAFLQAFEAAERAMPKLAAEGLSERPPTAKAGGGLERAHEAVVPFKAWVLRIAVNLGKNHVRDTARWARAPVSLVERQPAVAVPAQEALEKAEEVALTRRAVLELPNRQREVFTLRIDAGLPFAEVAATLGITEGNAKAHFHHALKRLKEEVAKLSKPGGTP